MAGVRGEYVPPVEQVLARLMLKHIELRSLENRKRLVVYAWRAYVPLFNQACNQEPLLVEQLILQAPDSDTILRTARKLQNDKGRLQDIQSSIRKTMNDIGARRIDDIKYF